MENAKLLNSIIESAIDGLITIDNRGLIETLNPAAATLFGYELQEVVGKNIKMLMPEPDKSAHDGYLERHERTGEKRIIGKGREVRGLRKDGSTFPFRLAVSEVQYENRKIYAGFIHDLSKEKEAEEQLRQYAAKLEELVDERTNALNKIVKALESAKEEVSTSLIKEQELGQLKSRFVSMASHEFRTPLSSVQLSASLIQKYAEPYDSIPIKKHVSKIKNAVGNLTTILNDFLSLEKLEAGRVGVNFSTFDLVSLSEEVTEEMQMIAKQNQHIIYQHTGAKNMVHLDQNLLRNCMINLISNSIKYSGEDTFIEFNTEINGDGCTVIVKDNGIGIPESDQVYLFEPFFRAHNTGNIPGTGLGLNIVRRHAMLMKGSLQFKSVLNQETTFQLTFTNNG